MLSVFRRLYQSEGWLNLVLLGGMLIVLVAATDEVHWVPQTGMLFGVLLAVSAFSIPLTRLPVWIALPVNLVLGQGLAFAITAQAMPVEQSLGQGQIAPRLDERMAALAFQVGDWFTQILSGGASANNNIFLLFLASLLALVVVVSIWATYHWHNALWAVVPIGTALLFNCSNAGTGAWWVVGYFVLALILLMRLYLKTQESRWEKKKIDYSDELFFDIFFTGVLISAAIALLVFLLPGASSNPVSTTFWGSFGHSWSRVEDTINRIFAGVRPAGTNQATALPGRGTVIIGSQTPLGDDVQLYVSADRSAYWQGNAYDYYTGQGWINQSSEEIDRNANQRLPTAQQANMQSLKARYEFTQTVTLQNQRLDVLFLAGQPLVVNQPYLARALSSDPNDISLLAQQRGLFGLGGYSSYQVVSLVSEATPDQLRSAPQKYPADIESRYLQLPPTLPPRVRDLTMKLIKEAGAQNTFDKASAVEKYLRTLTFTQNVVPLPAGRDATDFFLFDSKAGWADHFATAMVVMLRSAGIPARLATGYSTGTWDGSRFVVKVSDTHVWPEVYFPEYGWIEFEPTPNHALLHQPVQLSTGIGSDYDPDADLGDEHPEVGHGTPLPPVAEQPGFNWNHPAIIGGLGLLAILLLALGWRAYDEYTWRKLTPAQFVRRVYSNMSRLAAWLGRPQRAAETPAEYTAMLSKNLPPVRAELHTIASRYNESRYSSHPLAASARSETATAWRRARGAFWRLARLRMTALRARFTRQPAKMS